MMTGWAELRVSHKLPGSICMNSGQVQLPSSKQNTHNVKYVVSKGKILFRYAL